MHSCIGTMFYSWSMQLHWHTAWQMQHFSDSLQRLHADKKQKRKKGQAAPKEKPEEALAVVLFEDERQLQPVNPDLQNLEAWRPGRVLQIGETRFSITYNPPTAEKVQFSLTALCSDPDQHMVADVMFTLTQCPPGCKEAVEAQKVDDWLRIADCEQVQIHGRPLTGCPIVASAMASTAPLIPLPSPAHMSLFHCGGDHALPLHSMQTVLRGIVRSGAFAHLFLRDACEVLHENGLLQVSFAPEDDCQWQWFRSGSAWNTGTRPENQPQQSRCHPATQHLHLS